MIGAITLLGMLVGSLVLLPYADHYGRRTMNVVFLISQTLSMWLFLGAMVLRSSIWLLCVAAFVGGSVAIPLIGTMICYATELSTMEMMTLCTGISFFAEALTSVGIGLYFKYLKDAAVFYLMISCLLTVFCTLYVVYAKETPHFLFKMRRFQDCIDHLKLMAYWNSTTCTNLPNVEEMKIAREKPYHNTDEDT